MQWTGILRWLSDHSGGPMLLVFLLIVAATYLPRRKQRMESHANIPLRDDG